MKHKVKKRYVAERDYTIYPFMNLSLYSIEGEEWKDIPEFDGYYSISNYGRLRAAPRPINSITGQSYYTKERIRKQCLTKYYNTYTGDYTDQLSVHLRYEHKSYSFKVNRLVYEFFIAPPGTSMDNLLVVHKDGDNCNNRYDNLVLINGTELYAHGLQLKRRPRTGLKKKNGNRSTSLKNAPKVIAQYSLEGKKLREYDSVGQAAQANNTNRESIRLVAQQKMIQLHGFVYRFKEEPYHGEHAAFSVKKTITQYRPNGRKVRTYPSITEAGRLRGIDADMISKCARGKAVSAGGYIWRYSEDSYHGESNDKIGGKAKEIIQYTLGGKQVAKFPSVNQAARLTGFSAAILLDCAYKRSKVAQGYVWRFTGAPYTGEYSNYRRGKPVTQLTLEGKRKDTFATIEAAARATGLTPDNIQKNVNGFNKTAGGYVWRFATEKEMQKLPADTTKRAGGGKGKLIVCYSLEGKKLVVYPSITEAAKACDVNISSISSTLDHPTRTAAGFVWRTKGNRYWGALSKTPPPNKARTITQYDMEGRKIGVYKSSREAGIRTGASASTINQVTRGKFKTTGGFIWINGDGPKKIDTNEYFAAREERKRKVSKPVLKYSLQGKLLKEYPSISEAARQEGIKMSLISAVVNGKSKSAGGDYWQLKATL